MTLQFPEDKNSPLWERAVEQELLRQHREIQRLWLRPDMRSRVKPGVQLPGFPPVGPGMSGTTTTSTTTTSTTTTTTTPEHDPCVQCPDWGIDACWEFTLAGVVNDNCNDCSFFNQTHTLIIRTDVGWQLSNCVFQSDSNWTDTCNTEFFRLFYSASNPVDTWRLISLPQEMIEYRLPGSEWDCEGPNEMAFHSRLAQCNNWPSTITLTRCD